MNYTQLVSAIADLMHRTDLGAAIPTFISLAEARLNRHLRVRQMETDLAPTAILNNRITLAQDIADVKLLWVPGYEGTPIERQSILGAVSGGTQGLPTMYARTGERDLHFNGGGSVQGVLYRKIPALSGSNLTNWLVSESPDVYLYGALIQAAIYTKDDPLLYQEQYTAAVNEVSGNDQRYTGDLRARAR